MERFAETGKRKEQDESNSGVKNKVVQKWLVFFEKNVNKMVNLDQKTCKKKTMKGKLGKDNITSSLYKSTNVSSTKSGNPGLETIARPDLGFFADKTVK